MDDQQKKPDLRVQRPPSAADKSGNLSLDDRGKVVVYEWRDQLAGGKAVRDEGPDDPHLSLADDEMPLTAAIESDPKDLRVGYNPYESGLLVRKRSGRKCDLRELSNWIQTQRKASGNANKK
jgi:hypothetical protein